MFQSTPPAEARGDFFLLLDFIMLPFLFQSTPPAEARGDLRAMCARRGLSYVSIHSPRRSEGRQGGDDVEVES